MAETSFTDREVIQAAQNFVCMVVHSENDHGETEYVIGRKKVKLCNEWYTIPCKEHQKGEASLGRFFQGVFRTPTSVFCDPSGKELFRVTGGMNARQLTTRMSGALEKVKGPNVPAALWKRVQKMIADAKAHVEKDEFKKAIALCTKAGKTRGSDAFEKMSREALEEINEHGNILLELAAKLDNPSLQKTIIQNVASDFRGLPVSKKAFEELRKKK